MRKFGESFEKTTKIKGVGEREGKRERLGKVGGQRGVSD